LGFKLGILWLWFGLQGFWDCFSLLLIFFFNRWLPIFDSFFFILPILSRKFKPNNINKVSKLKNINIKEFFFLVVRNYFYL
jgi:hypothetical protein